MTNEVEIWIQGIHRHIEKAIEDTLEDVSKAAVAFVQARIPPNRVETRKSVRRKRIAKSTVSVGLYFRNKFPGNNTKTHKYFRQIARELRPLLKSMVVRKLNSRLQK